jgi:hypothetical protein|tara:strand:- start:412 stop:549 length:138 start_codon:yes stop_codon:yes gene_type:complete
MKKEMDKLIMLTTEMKNELHTTNRIAITVSVVNVITLGVIFWGLM